MYVALVGLVFTGVLLLAFGTWLVILPVGMVAGILLLQALLMAEREFFTGSGRLCARGTGAVKERPIWASGPRLSFPSSNISAT